MVLLLGAVLSGLVALALRHWLLKTDKSRLAGWYKDTAPSGLPVWRGKDSIFNFQHHTGHEILGAGLLLGIIGAVLLASFLITAFSPYKGDDLSSGYALAAGVLMIGARILLRHGNRTRGKFIGQAWTLAASNDGITFKGNDRWAVSLDAVARVETARTVEYTPARQFGSQLRNTPADEWQTFIFLNDGTRRVIYHANADRDGCAALAASIREYVEAARSAAAAPESPNATPAPPADGFDL